MSVRGGLGAQPSWSEQNWGPWVPARALPGQVPPRDAGGHPIQRIPAPSPGAGMGSLMEDEELKLLPASTAHACPYVGHGATREPRQA